MTCRSAREWPRRLAAVVALVLATAAPVLAQRSDPARLLESGRRAYDTGDYARARTDLWEYLDATATLTGPSRLPQAEALFLIARMEPDAGVAAQHYQTIVTEYPASTVADEALMRLGQYALVAGRTEEARERFTAIKQNYPFSRLQGELPLWIGRTFLAERRYRAATDVLIEGFSNVRTGNLPYELSGGQRDALAAEYAYWLATAFSEEGDQRTAIQYWSVLTLDYPGSPQASEARAALASGGFRVEEPAPRLAAGEEGLAETLAMAPAEETVIVEEQLPARAEPEVVEEQTAPPAEPEVGEEPTGGEPVYRPLPPREPPEREEARAVEEPPREEPARRAEPAREEAAPDEGGPPKFPAPDGRGAVFIQVGAFTSATSAAELSKRLKQDGFPSRVEIAIVEGRGYYRVRVGPYPDDTQALRDAEARLGELGYPTRRVAPGS